MQCSKKICQDKSFVGKPEDECRFLLFSGRLILASAVHILKLERYREDYHGPCTRINRKIVKCSTFFHKTIRCPFWSWYGEIFYRPPVSGIHGNPAVGCYSLALSGGYEDDVDLGDSFIYTGEGGRDLRGTKTNPKNLRTAPQSKDQLLEKGNLALARNVESGLPVRVLRGYKLRSNYAPEEGYRYDGLYKVVKYYMTTGLSGFKVYKFHLERIKEQAPAPWAEDFIMTEASGNLGFCSDKENVPKDEDRLQNKKEKNPNSEPLSAEENITKQNGQRRESSDSSAIHSPEEENASKEEQL
ncbi:E3 ubiquitin-protein ligase UHRF1 [Araneus ventricosus]|uniref:E3 ubiquitin-protein ligase UHRF1 n=1 Tax=Araneus ventricosus TaxID=182803 RepID=A0A4Y2SGS3_ARAVE|nr:E3 ubiquitin-protein ligase UHRF1 [Araneus ventricosus]